jgi:metallo-beta-lactamase class B
MKSIAAAVAALAFLGAAHGAEPFAAERADWNKPSEPFHIVGNVWYVGTEDLAVFLIKTPAGAILMDAGLPESVPLIEKNIATLGVQLKDIKYLIDLHAHFDHAGGLAELQQKTGAKVVSGAGDKPILERGYITFGPSAPIHFPPVHVDRTVKDGDMLILGGAQMTARATPGHTPGCTAWTLSVREGGVRYHVVFSCSITVAGNPLVNNAEYPQIVTDYRSSFADLKALKADVFLAEHARVFDAHGKAEKAKAGGPNPFVDAGEMQRVVQAGERDFEAELARQQVAAKP